MKNLAPGIKNKIFNSIKFGMIGLIISLIIDLLTGHSEFIFESAIIGTLIGFLIGLFENFITIPRFRRTKFYLLVLIRTLVYSGIIISSIFTIVLFKLSFAHQCTLIDLFNNNQLSQYFFENNLHIYFPALVGLSFIINVIWQINLLLGKGVLLKYISGKYHKPTRGSRIFLFIDLKSSTSIAERLGDERYSLFLQDFFYDLTDPILESKGEVFQYCGDEVVIVWDKKRGLKNNRALKLFFDADKKIKLERNKYLKKYGLYPEFKAGLHSGEIIITEVGSIKKEIAFHGDLINTSSRILGTCNKVNKRFLVSEDFLNQLENDNEIEKEFIGEFKLKGKKVPMNLFSIEMKGEKLDPLNSNCEERIDPHCLDSD